LIRKKNKGGQGGVKKKIDFFNPPFPSLQVGREGGDGGGRMMGGEKNRVSLTDILSTMKNGGG